MASPGSPKRARRHESLSQGRPRYRPDSREFVTGGGVRVARSVTGLNADEAEVALGALVEELDAQRGCIFESAYEYPGRYARWTMGFSKPPLALESWGLRFRVSALNARGRVLLGCFESCLRACDAVDASSLVVRDNSVDGRVKPLAAGARFTEEERSKQPSIFSVVRAVIELWSSSEDPQLGLYGSFGYDLTFQFEPVELAHARDPAQRDLLLYLPDQVLVFDKQMNQGWRIEYEFSLGAAGAAGGGTRGLAREGASSPFVGNLHPARRRDHGPGEYAAAVERARGEFKVGNLFECVLSQTFYEPCGSKPSEILGTLRVKNPSPYMFVINLGEQEWLVGASPEMFVRVEQTAAGMRVETCPISGTIKRGDNALEDADRILEILANRKEESELTMCTDVDRNDKSRICRQGSVEVIGRRQIEKYSRLIHTVDHVEGYLRDGFDALDAFLVHTWAVTVTGAPKVWAIQFVERNEKSPRCWYGGAVGLLGFDGSLNTGLTLRTIRLKEGVAEIRAGATLLYDSKPEDEERETELKASAFRDAVLSTNGAKASPAAAAKAAAAEDEVAHIYKAGRGKKVVLIDHQDSFVHTLANYLRQTGAEVSTVRFGVTRAEMLKLKPDLVVMSPGPGCPKDFDCSGALAMLAELRIPVFGVCLGLQSMVEHFGAKLDVLAYPMHGKPSDVVNLTAKPGSGAVNKWRMFEGLPERFTVARYHSLYGTRQSLLDNKVLSITAQLDDGTVMAIEHKTLPFAGVQFHPESILTRPKDGLTMLANALTYLHY